MIRISPKKGTQLRCKGWKQEAILRMLENNLHNAELPDELIIYGGTGKAARNWESYDTIVKTLKQLEFLIIEEMKKTGPLFHKGNILEFKEP